MKKKTIALLVALTISSTSCSSFGIGGIKSSEHGYVSLEGDREGIIALSDTFQGMITNGKADANAPDTPYYQLKREQNRNNAEVRRYKYGLQFGSKK